MTFDGDEEFDPHHPEFLRDPYPLYAAMRQSRAVHFLPSYGAWWVFRDADVRRVLEDAEGFLKNSPAAFGAQLLRPSTAQRSRTLGLFSADPPWHTELRQTLEPLFRSCMRGAKATTASRAHELLDHMSTLGRGDLVSSYALPLPARVLLCFIGVPSEDWEKVIGWVSAIATAHDVTQPRRTRLNGAIASKALSAYFRDALNRPVASEPIRLLDMLIVEADSGGLPRALVEASLHDIVVAGYLSTTFLIGAGLRYLLTHPLARKRLKEDETLWPDAIDELLRIDAPAQIVDRIAAYDAEFGGVTVKAGDKLALVVGSANRDPCVYREPDEFIIDRGARNHLGFGSGIHTCIGAPLARIVTPIALRELLNALPSIRVAGVPQWQTDPYLRGAVNLPIAWG